MSESPSANPIDFYEYNYGILSSHLAAALRQSGRGWSAARQDAQARQAADRRRDGGARGGADLRRSTSMGTMG